MTVREAKAEANMNRWQAIIAEQRQSGQSIVEFCTGRQITTGQFYKWQRKVLNRLIESQSGSNEEQRVCVFGILRPLFGISGAAAAAGIRTTNRGIKRGGSHAPHRGC